MTSDQERGEPRYAKGVNLTQLVPVLRKLRRDRPIGALSPGAQRLIDERILEHLWYPHSPFVDLLRVMDRELLRGSEAAALTAGIAGGKHALQGTHKTFVIAGDPVASVMSMRHSWRAYFNFGELKATVEAPRSVVLTLTGYPDVLPVHAGMIVGWAVAAAQLAGSHDAASDILDKPWVSGQRLIYRVRT